jgi:hypothetical protein
MLASFRGRSKPGNHGRLTRLQPRRAVVVVALRNPLRYRIGCLPLPNHYACRWLVGRFGQGSRSIVGIAGKRQKAEGRMEKKGET